MASATDPDLFFVYYSPRYYNFIMRRFQRSLIHFLVERIYRGAHQTPWSAVRSLRAKVRISDLSFRPDHYILTYN